MKKPIPPHTHTSIYLHALCLHDPFPRTRGRTRGCKRGDRLSLLALPPHDVAIPVHMSKFEEVKRFDHSILEEDMLSWWKEHRIFERSIEERAGCPSFTFYEGPPTANGRPGIHHVMARTIKDAFCRYKTMKGFRIERKAGWDTHGLPVEIEVEKELGLEGRWRIEEYGIDRYNAKCRQSVLRYKEAWDALTERMGYWVDLSDPYVTFENRYIETEWWLLKQMHRKGLLYRGHKIQWYSPGSETVLSSHEVSLGYREVQDPSIYVQFPLRGAEDTFFLAWTTTPWTLVSNAALAVGPDVDYVKVRTTDAQGRDIVLILAEDRLGVLHAPRSGDARGVNRPGTDDNPGTRPDTGHDPGTKDEGPGDRDLLSRSPDHGGKPCQVLERLRGRDLVGMAYEPVFACFVGEPGHDRAWRVVQADFVSTEEGTGIVHVAPAFGADDYDTGRREGLPVFNPIRPNGTFDDRFDLIANQWFKEADRPIIRDLKRRRLLYRQETCLHNYPHDWRKGTPLMSYPVESWFVRTTAIKDRLIELNETINWQPTAMGTGRFGEWLRKNVDWALSRKRYWGTPLPIWLSDKEGSEYMEIIGSMAELREKCGDQLPESNETIDLHKPFVDALTWPAPDGGTMRRVPEVIDVWFDSGSMPFSQWHYPFENVRSFEERFPADFIAEGIDQTRGWFYTMHVIAAAVMDSVAYRNVVVNGLVLDEHGEKMSKSRGNVVDPFATIETWGADVVRWYMMSNTPPWENIKFSERGLVDTLRKFFNTLENVYAFFGTYANIDGFTGAGKSLPVHERTELDRWIMSRVHSMVHTVNDAYGTYDPTRATRVVERFVDDLSNWYVRRSRRRFWKEADSGVDKEAAYWTVYECLLTVSKVMAPIAPFFADWLYQRLEAPAGRKEFASVHLAPFPQSVDAEIDRELERRMDIARRIVSVVLSMRSRSQIHVRQPLPRIMVATKAGVGKEDVERCRDIIAEEVNVKQIEYISGSSGLVRRSARPRFKRLGRRLGRLMKSVDQTIRALDDAQIGQFLENGSIMLDIGSERVELGRDDVEIRSEGIEGWLVGQEHDVTVALDTTITEDLRAEGLAREIIHRIQHLRKQGGFEVTDRIIAEYHATGLLAEAIRRHALWIRNETLAISLQDTDVSQGKVAGEGPGEAQGKSQGRDQEVVRGEVADSFDIGGQTLWIGVRRAVDSFRRP